MKSSSKALSCNKQLTTCEKQSDRRTERLWNKLMVLQEIPSKPMVMTLELAQMFLATKR